MNSLVHQSSYPIYISYSSAISGFQSENIRDVGIDCLPKTDQKETVANFNLIRRPRHRLSPNFLFCCKFPTHLKHIQPQIGHLPTKTWMFLSAHPLHRVFWGPIFSEKCNPWKPFLYPWFFNMPPFSYMPNIFFSNKKSLKKVVFGSRKVSIHPSSHQQLTSFSCHL